ncbi:hypothetical protein [Roseateles sp. BYS87W]|uniref:Uncharacterized protein n=1 Tax=Pelomonas baiyunensis TaxID=3299026 RepID=A0ABW7H256_9BURK
MSPTPAEATTPATAAWPIRPARRHQRHSTAAFAACGAAWMAGVVAVIAWVPQVRAQQALGVASFALLCVALWALDRHLALRFRCPQCGGPVLPPEPTGHQDRAPLLRACPACQVRWQVGRTPSAG